MSRHDGEDAQTWYDRALEEATAADRDVRQYLAVGHEQPDERIVETSDHQDAASRWHAAQEDLARASEAVRRDYPSGS